MPVDHTCTRLKWSIDHEYTRAGGGSQGDYNSRSAVMRLLAPGGRRRSCPYDCSCTIVIGWLDSPPTAGTELCAGARLGPARGLTLPRGLASPSRRGRGPGHGWPRGPIADGSRVVTPGITGHRRLLVGSVDPGDRVGPADSIRRRVPGRVESFRLTLPASDESTGWVVSTDPIGGRPATRGVIGGVGPGDRARPRDSVSARSMASTTWTSSGVAITDPRSSWVGLGARRGPNRVCEASTATVRPRD